MTRVLKLVWVTRRFFIPKSPPTRPKPGRVVSGNSICMDLQGIADGACTAGDPVMVIMSVSL